MTAIVETSTFETEITQLETTDLVLGGADGVSNRALKQLANRTRWLYNQLLGLTEQPLQALPYPTIATADNRLTVTPASATAGGTVSIAAGTRLTLAEEVSAGATGRLRTYTTALYTSADLVASSTYYLRAQVDSNGDLLVYTQRGTDSDTIPAGLKGTPDAVAGGGFDSTVLDVLLARVVTGVAGSVPVVTALANAARLEQDGDQFGVSYQDADLVASPPPGVDGYTAVANPVAINWARTPHVSVSGILGVQINTVTDTYDLGIGARGNRYNVEIVLVHYLAPPAQGMTVSWHAHA